MAHSGYDKERFTNLMFDSFDCMICCEVAMDPRECENCGKIFCRNCIDDWMKKSPTVPCPNRCKSKIGDFKSKALLRMYLNLDIKCSNEKCQKVIKLQKIKEHQESCNKPNCYNFKICQSKANPAIISDEPYCSQNCYVFGMVMKNKGDKKKLFDIVSQIAGGPQMSSQFQPTSGQLCWDTSSFGTGLIVSESNTLVFLKEQNYVFRSITANIGFSSGVNYWEIIADPRTENELKIGITGSKNFEMNSAFCDHPFGYGFYGLGQLRNGSNAAGTNYGKRFKKSGVLGICLDMTRGTLSFSLDNEFLGVAFNDQKLKSGTYFPAVALLHCGGCKIRGGVPLPSCFK